MVQYSAGCVGRFLDQLLCKTHAAIDEWQTEMLLRALRVGKVQLYSPLMSSRPDDVAASGVMLRPRPAMQRVGAGSNDSRLG